jgi:Dehydrogenase E1 component
MRTQPDRLAEQDLSLAPEELEELYRGMVLLRRTDSLFVALARERLVPFAGAARGLEAILAGTAASLGPADWLYADPRTASCALLRGYPFAEHLEQWLGTGRDRAHGRALPGLPSCVQGHFPPVTATLGVRAYEALGTAWAVRRAQPATLVACLLGPSEMDDLRPLDALERASRMGAPLFTVLVGRKPLTDRWMGMLADHGIPHAFASAADGAWIAASARKLAEGCRSGPGPAALVCEERRAPDPVERAAALLAPSREREIRRSVHEDVRRHVVEALGEARAHVVMAAVEARDVVPSI